MKPALLLLVLFLAGFAVLFAIQRQVDPGRSVEAGAPPVPLLVPSDAPTHNAVVDSRADPTPDPGVSAEELDHFGRLFAAEPALIDALEDAGSADPIVRAEAQEVLSSLDLQAADTAADAAANAAR